MRRRHLLALIILALVVATVLATGPVRVWKLMTLRTVEEPWPQITHRYDFKISARPLVITRPWPSEEAVTI